MEATLQSQKALRIAKPAFTGHRLKQKHQNLKSPHNHCVCSAANPPQQQAINPLQSSGVQLCCPICLSTPLTSSLYCKTCNRNFERPSSTPYTDLVITAPSASYTQSSWGGTELFRSPVISFVYERGWRQGFSWAGFPGADEEYNLAIKWLLPAAQGQPLLDLSCGSGLFTRRFITSKQFSHVIAADYSENMLKQTKTFITEDASITDDEYSLLRLDVARLPFKTGSLSAIHAGAALHCWPNPIAAMAEISRVLKPGGVFVASTFLSMTAPLGQFLGNDGLVEPLDAFEPQPGAYKWWKEGEIKGICEAVGLENYQRDRRLRFIMFSVTKPLVGNAV